MLKGIYGVLIAMLVILTAMFVSLFINPGHPMEQQTAIQNPRYHLQLLVKNKEESFWISFREGAKAAEEEYGVYIEFVPVEQINPVNLRETVEMGVNQGVDGIALQAADSEQTQQIIDQAKKQGVQIITYENSNYIVSDIPMVGTNNYSLGNYAGDMAVDASKGVADVAVIINGAGNEGDKTLKNLIIEGINNAFDNYGQIRISDIYTINTDMFEAEKVASEILNKEDIPDLIICMDEKCTPGIAQILVDNNMVGDIKLVGYGITAQTLNYIEHGVIYGTVCPDAYEIGYDTVKALVQMLNGEQVSEIISTSLYTIDIGNVNEFKDNAAQ